MTAEERREYARTPLNGTLELGDKSASLLDVSEGGVRVRLTDAPGEWGDAVVLHKVGEDVPCVRCHIVRVLADGFGYQVGLRFDPTEPNGLVRLLRLLS